jgi:AcrR family transcriptional regulator
MASLSIPKPEAGRAGRPRSQKAREAILKATVRLFRFEHLQNISMDAVAERAGVSKATIYRWWNSKGTLALDAFLAELTAEVGPQPDSGSFLADLRIHIRALVASYSGPAGKMLTELVAAFPTDPELANDFRDRVVTAFRQRNRIIFERAAKRGEIAAGTDTELAMDILYGAIWLRLLLGIGTLDDGFADALVTVVVKGLKRGTSPKAA